MKSIASAPGKIILFGEHFVVHGTKAILAAIDKRVTVTTTFTENKTIKINSELGTIEVPISSSHEEVKSEFRPFVYLANKMINSNQNVHQTELFFPVLMLLISIFWFKALLYNSSSTSTVLVSKSSISYFIVSES